MVQLWLHGQEIRVAPETLFSYNIYTTLEIYNRIQGSNTKFQLSLSFSNAPKTMGFTSILHVRILNLRDIDCSKLQNYQKTKYVFEKQKQELVSKMEFSFLFSSVLTPEGTHADSYKGRIAGAAKENSPWERSFGSFQNSFNIIHSIKVTKLSYYKNSDSRNKTKIRWPTSYKE